MGGNLYDRQHQPVNGAIPAHRMGGAVHKLQQNPQMAQTISRTSAVVLGAMGVHIAYTSLKDWA